MDMKHTKETFLELWKEFSSNNLISHLGMEFVELGEDYLTLKMPVNQSVTQIDGILHGGATLALAETVGSIAARVLYCNENESVRGVELSGNHVRGGKLGDTIFAKATCIHAGRTLQVWDIKITNQDEKLISFCKFTTFKI